MNILKKIVLGLVILIALFLIVAFFTPRSYTVSVSETINQPQSLVYNYVKMLKNQEEYSEWVKADTNMHPEIIGEDGTVGAVQKWNSSNDNVGEGQQTITHLTPERMDMDLHFIRPFEGKAKAANIFKAVNDNQTIITAEFYSNDKYPMNLMSYFLGRKMIEKVQTQNLKNIKAILEKTN